MHNFDELSGKSALAVSSAGVELALGETVYTGNRPRPFLDVLSASGFDWEYYSIDVRSAYSTLNDMGVQVLDVPELRKDIAASTVAWVNKGLKVLDLYHDGQQIPWSSTLGPFEFDSATKLGKRLSLFSWQSDLHVMGVPIVEVFGDDSDTMGDDTVTVLFTDDNTPLSDGISYIRPTLFFRMMANAILENREHYSKVIDFNGRCITPWGLIKGNFRVAKHDSDLPADIVTSKPNNLKTEVRSNNGKGYMVMYPEHSNWFGQVYVDRQTRMHFFDSMFTLDMIDEWMDNWINRMAADLEMNPRIPSWSINYKQLEEGGPGTITSFTEKFVKWNHSSLAIQASPALIKSLAYNAEMAINPKSRKADAVKAPEEFAVRVILRSETDMITCGYSMPRLMPNQVFVTRGCLVVRDDEYPAIAKVLGGGDKDDHVVVRFRRDSNTGAIFVQIVRNPIGGAFDSNGTRCSEYWKAVCINAEELLDKHYGPDNWVLPVVDAFAFPMRMDRGDFPEPTFNVSERIAPVYDVDLVVDLAIGSADAMIAYGVHSNLVMFAVQYDIPLAYYAPEETFVDVCQQVPFPEDVSLVQAYNDAHASQIAIALSKGLRPDPLDFDRVAIPITEAISRHNLKPVETEPGLASAIFDIHTRGLNMFNSRIGVVITEIVAGIKERFPYNTNLMTYPEVHGRAPWINGGFTRMETLKGAKLTTAEYVATGNVLADFIARPTTSVEADTLISELLGFVGKFASRGRDGHIRNLDTSLLNGRLLDLYISFLEEKL